MDRMAGGKKRACSTSRVVVALSVVAGCVLVAGGVVVAALYLAFRPQEMRASADAADLGNFTLEPRTWILRYNLSLEQMHVRVLRPKRNPCWTLRYHRLHAQAFYQGQRIARHQVSSSSQLVSSLPRVVFFGQAPLRGGVAAAAFRREAGDNATFSIDVKLDARTKLKLLWLLWVPGPNPKIDCQLRIRRRKRATFELRPGSFSPTQCKVSL